MGTWGFGIRQDDFVRDVIGEFEDLLKRGTTVRDASDGVKSKFRADISDTGDDPLFWIALAEMQWTYGELEAPVLNRVQDDLHSGRSLAAWTEDPRGFARRKSALENFVRKIAQPNPRPKKPPKTVVRAPKFQPGDCLSIRLPDGQYAAAFVLAANHSNAEYGTNLVGVLDYLSSEKPTLEVFRQRNWRVPGGAGSSTRIDVAWYHYLGFATVRNRLEVVGQAELLASDPTDSNVYRRWTGIGERANSPA